MEENRGEEGEETGLNQTLALLFGSLPPFLFPPPLEMSRSSSPNAPLWACWGKRGCKHQILKRTLVGPGGPQEGQEEPGRARGGEEGPGGPREGQEDPGRARRTQGGPGGSSKGPAGVHLGRLLAHRFPLSHSSFHNALNKNSTSK